MKTKIEIKSIWGSLLFTFEKEDNSIKDTLVEAVKQGAYLQGAYSQNTILPEGDIIIWKKLRDDIIAKLLVPAKAKRVNAIGSRKCRFEYTQTLALFQKGRFVKKGTIGRGLKNPNTLYIVGEITKPDSFDPSPLIECSNGIHGFITRQEAQNFDI